VGGLLGGTQTGQGFFDPRKPPLGEYIDFIFNAGKGSAETFSGQKVPGHFKNGKLLSPVEGLIPSLLSRGRGVSIIL
jgi:hypothetical protein